MTAPRQQRYDFSWSRRDLAALLVLTSVTAGVAILATRGREPHPYDRPPAPQQQAAMGELVNPNTARVASLMRLPGVGRALAEEIVRYRADHGPDAFATPEDLARVKGIGEGTVEKMRPLLDLPPRDPPLPDSDESP
jgi:competence ComEA-like helix-hairpin-helix protein